ncbi:MAG: hypothetical protein ABGX26_02675 [Nautiliaceae bacterium]
MNFELLRMCVDLLEKSNFCKEHKYNFTKSKEFETMDFKGKIPETNEEKFNSFCFEKLH